MDFATIVTKIDTAVRSDEELVNRLNDILALNIDNDLAQKINKIIEEDIFVFREDENIDLTNKYNVAVIMAIMTYILFMSDKPKNGFQYIRLFISDSRDAITVRMNPDDPSELFVSEILLEDAAVLLKESDEIEIGVEFLFNFLKDLQEDASLEDIIEVINLYNKEKTKTFLKYRVDGENVIYAGSRAVKTLVVTEEAVKIVEKKLFFNQSSQTLEFEESDNGQTT